YENNGKVMHISGYSPPVIDDQSCDGHFIRRPLVWGWATWKRAWNLYTNEKTFHKNLLNDGVVSKRAKDAGKDLSLMLNWQMEGWLDSWDVYWTYCVLYYNGLSLVPSQSFISNIGNDGSGSHTGATNYYQTTLTDKKHDFSLPAVALNKEIEKKVAFFLSGGFAGIGVRLMKQILPHKLY